MKINYISGSALSVWYGLKSRWVKLYLKVKLSKKKVINHLEKLNSLSLKMGVKKSIAIASLCSIVTVGANAQVSFSRVEETNLTLKNEIGTSGYGSAPNFVDFDGDNDLDLVAGGSGGELQYFKNEAGTFVKQEGANSPFNGIDAGSYSHPAIIDFDDDNDLDLIVGNSAGNILYYKNESGQFVSQIGTNNPFNGIDVGSYSTPFIEDVDGDGDLDLVSGNNAGTITYYENDNSSFVLKTDDDNPFKGITAAGSSNSVPVLKDFNKDESLDLLIGSYDGQVKFYEKSDTAYIAKTGADNPFDGIDAGWANKITLVDLDEDNDLDLVYGEYYGKFYYYENNNGTFAKKSGSVSPIGGFGNYSNWNYYAFPTLVDLDGDNDMDIVSGDYYGGVTYYKNTALGFEKLEGNNGPFKNIRAIQTRPEFADFDGDGDDDLLLGNSLGTIYYYENIEGVFNGTTGGEIKNTKSVVTTPFSSIDVGNYSHPSMADIDGDGDLDLLIGAVDGLFHYYNFEDDVFTKMPITAEQNEEHIVKEVSALRTTSVSNNPFDGLDVGTYSSPELYDLDGDGDLDLTSGDLDGLFHYFENVNGSYIERTGVDNPFDGFDIGRFSAPAFGDLSGNGFLDMVSGANGATIAEYESSIRVGLMTKSEGKNSISVFPNPALENIYVERAGGYHILSISGVEMLRGVVNNDAIDISSLPKGVYILNLEGVATSFIKK